MTDVIKSFCATSTDSHHAAIANLLREIIMVRDNFLTLPGLVNSVLHVLCVLFADFSVFICIVCYMSLSIVYFAYDFNIK